MSLVINNNLMAKNVARNLGNTYDRLSSSVQRLSSGLRINSAADDAAGLAIRELMRADISTMQQGIRNAADAISMIQPADGAMADIDEKLVRMKELAEQASTGTYTTLQREIINSEYQAMAAEIDRIANATNFNGVKLLDGSISNQHGGQGMKIHFGVGNNPDEDYYFITTGDVRATSSTGLRIGGDAKNDIWGQGAAGAAGLAGPGCCTAGYDSLDGNAGFKSGDTFAYGYNWDWMEYDDPDLLSGRYLAGRYTVNSSDSLQDLIDKVNLGTQSRVGIKLDASAMAEAIKFGGGTAAVCIGDEAYIFGSASVAGGTKVIPGNEGTVYRHLAEGSYDDDGFVFNSSPGYGFGLTVTQVRNLQRAGVDLSNLNLQSAMVSASAASTESSAAARNMLTRKLAEVWRELGLDGLSALATQAGAASGFVIDEKVILASATSAALSGTGILATLVSGQTLTVHTGVYADAAGNWTDNLRIASALGLEEIVFHISNDGTMQSTATLKGGSVFKSPEYLINEAGDLGIVKSEYDKMAANGFDLAALCAKVASASVTGDFKGTGDTAASALAELGEQISAAWKAKYGAVQNVLKYSANDSGVTLNLFPPDWATIMADPANAGVALSAGSAGQVQFGTGPVTVHTGIYKQEGEGNWTSSKALADKMNAMGIKFEEVVLKVRNEIYYPPNTYYITISGTPFTPFMYPITDITDPSTLTVLRDATASVLEDGYSSYGRLWQAPEDGSSSLFPPDPTQVAALADTSDGIPGNLTVTVDMAGKTSDVTTGNISNLPRNTTTLAALLNCTATAVTKLLTDAQQAAAATTMTGMGRLVTRPATAPAGNVTLSDIDNLTQSSAFVSGELVRSVAQGSYTYSAYSYSTSSNIGLNKAQLSALQRAGVDLDKLHLANPTVSASAFSTESSASARAALVDKLNQIWNALNFDTRVAMTVNSGAMTGYASATSATILAGTLPGILTGVNGAASIQEGQTLTVRTGVYMDLYGNWTDDSAIAAALGLKEVTYELTNDFRSWVNLESKFRTSALTDGQYMVTSALSSALSSAGLTLPTSFLKTSVSVYASARTSAIASALLYTSGLTAWNALYGGTFGSIQFDAAAGNETALADFTYSQMALSGSTANLTGNGAYDRVRSGQTVTVHTGVWTDTAGNWTTDSALASMFSLTEITYTVANDSTNTLYTITRNDATGTAGAVTTAPTDDRTLAGLGIQLAADARSFINGAQTAAPWAQGHLTAGPQTRPITPTAANVNALRAPVNYKDNGVTYLTVTVNLNGDPYPPEVGMTFPYSPGPLQIAHDGNVNAIAGALNTHFAAVISGLQLQAIGNGRNGVGRIVNALNTPPIAVITEADVKDLSWTDHYKPAASDQTVTVTGMIDKFKYATLVASAGTAYANASGHSNFGAWALASAINHNAKSQFWAMVQSVDSNGKSADMVYVFAKQGGNLNSLLACDVADGDAASREALDAIEFENVADAKMNQSGTSFTLGGEQWGTLKPTQTRAGMGKEVWNLTLHGRDVGKERDLWIAAVSNGVNEVKTPGLNGDIINGLDRYSFVEIQNAANGNWAGAEVRTQSAAQEALDALNEAMTRKDKVRADLGALQNRLENTMTNLEIQVETLQASESRISDIDIATEMTEFVRNQVLAQAAVSMLSQANSLPQMALSLLNG
jgi:flagellin-like hook-associated protein FlgL